MNHFRKFLALALAALMVIGATVSVGAKRFDDVANDNQYAEQIDLLSEIGIILGTSENEFSPDVNVSREQMALLLYRMMLGDNNAGNINTSPFTDLYDPTYHGAISWAAANEYILGTTPTQFAPREGILFQDAITMLVRLLGHETDKMNKGYPWTYIEAGVKLGLTDGLESLSYNQVMTRGQIAGLLYNALTADYLIPKNIAGNIFYETSTVIEEVFGYSIEEAVLTSTNDYALPGYSRVIKNNYVTLTYDVHSGDSVVSRTIYVNYEELGFKTAANNKLGERVKIIFTVDAKTNLVSVLGALEIGHSKTFDSVTVGNNNKYVEIDGVQYNVVPSYSDVLGTNNNELLVYRYNTDGSMTQINDNASLSANLGFYSIEMIYDDNGNIASRAILTPYAFNQLQLDRNGGINIAGGLTTAQLTGGILNPAGAEAGDYVLYFYNSALKALEIKQPLIVLEGGLVTRLTATEASIGGVSYKLGKSGTGITAASIAAQLTIGTKANIVVYEGHIVGVTEAVAQTNSSKYLIAMSATTPVYAEGGVRYFMTANIDGVNSGIFVASAEVEQGKVYRYLVDDNGFYHLIPMTLDVNNVIISGANNFVQNTNGLDELALYIDAATQTTITRGDNFYYTLGTGEDTLIGSAGVTTPIHFLTNDETVILVNTASGIRVKTGSYSSTISVNEGASVTAIFNNRPGSIEMLRYLYISDGELGSVNEGANYAKVYSTIGLEFVNGAVMTAYKAYNFSTGAIETFLSSYNALQVGTTYAIDGEGHLSNIERRTVSGIVTGYNDGIVTIGGEVYKLAENAKIHSVNSSLAVSSLKLEDVYMHNVEIFAEGREIKTILVGDALNFSASSEGNTITLAANLSLASIEDPQINLNSVTHNGQALSLEAFSLTAEGDNLLLASGEELADGLYVISVNFYDQAFVINYVKTTPEAE
ncbi:MAG: S-layer homology domain-containing protein [Clostridia bacterium]|nr:S-layer homology domain-containing protein [Clostridia bacterium]